MSTPTPWKVAEKGRVFLDTAYFIRCVNEGTEYGATVIATSAADAAFIVKAVNFYAAAKSSGDI
jgi:hypothetical protein